MDIASAEMVKLASNAFLATKISFINEIANVSRGDRRRRRPRSRAAWASTTASGRSSCSPASASAARCFPKDVSALKQLAGNSGYHFQLLTAVIEVNELQKRRVIGKLKRHLGSLVGKRIALLGLAFKPNTDDMREASSLVLAGPAAGRRAPRSRAYDPIAEDEARTLMPTASSSPRARSSAVRDADAVVLVTEWQEFRDLDWREVADAMRGDLLIDGRNALDAAARARPPGCATRASGAAPGQSPSPPRRGAGVEPASTGAGPG